MARSTRRSGSTSASSTSTASARTPARAITSSTAQTGQAERARTQYEYPQGSACFIQSRRRQRWRTSCGLATQRGDALQVRLRDRLRPLDRCARPARSSAAAASPSGPLSFLKVYDQVANVVKSGGKTRRAAKMNTLKDWHPDIEEFIEAKTEGGEESLGAHRAGLRRLLQRRRLRLDHVPEREPLRPRERRIHERRHRGPASGGPGPSATASRARKRTRARCCARSPRARGSAATPACSSTTTIHNWHTCKGTDRQHSTNPCSEYLFLDNTACNLASLNLMKFKKADGSFDVEALQGRRPRLHHRAGNPRR